MSCSCAISFLAHTLLAVVALNFAVRLVNYLYKRLLCTPLDPKTCGQWAVVTGATDGIGKGFVNYLGEIGMDVVLVSRTQKKLEDLAKQLEDKYKINTKVIAVDFSKDETEYIGKLESELNDLDIGLLINNVGMGGTYPDYFLEHDKDAKADSSIEDPVRRHLAFVRGMVNCNITSMNVMTRLVLPKMLDKGKGAIVNMSSIGGYIPVQMCAAYAATKSYNLMFAQAVAREYSKKGITFMCVTPGWVATEMSKRRPTFDAPMPGPYAGSVLSRLGIEDNTPGYWAHDLFLLSIEWMPSCLQDYMMTKEMLALKEEGEKARKSE